MDTYLITGATQGLGRATAAALAADPAHRVVLAVRDLARGRAVAAELGANVEAVRLDLSSIAEVRRFVEDWDRPLRGLVNNAGVQLTGPTRRTGEGLEETLAVNHLAAMELTIGLLPLLEGGRVLFIGSGTHNPENRTATMFGFRGARYSSIEALARRDGDGVDERQLGLDRYATSKFLNTISGVELARRHDPSRVAFFTLDPGLMAGTGLARTAPAVVRLLWSTVLRWISPLLPDTSTPERSGAAAAWVMTDPALGTKSGEIFAYDRAPSKRVWERVRDPEMGRRAVDDTLEFLAALKV
jgi:NAD(P)-dependent dehydrogenase (short-subunit alcohol dehydrogenase family)